MNNVPPTQPTLLVRIRDARDQEAWGRFVDLYAPLVYGFLHKRGLQDADAADLTQDVMRQVAVAAHGLEYDPRRGSFRGWLFTIVQNRLTDHWRWEGVREHGTGDSGAHQQLHDLPQPEGLDASALWNADYERQLLQYASNVVRRDFGETTWLAFWKTAVDGLPGKRVAEELGLTIAAVYLAKGRVMTRLKQVKLLAKKRGDRFQSAKAVAENLEKRLAHVQQPSVAPRPLTVEADSEAGDQPSSSTSKREASQPRTPPSKEASVQRDESRRFLDSGTILFQPISGRWVLFVLLTAMTVMFAVSKNGGAAVGEALLVAIMGGMFLTFWGLLFVALVRLVWANLSQTVPWAMSDTAVATKPLDDSNGSRSRAGFRLPPESVAMLAALGTMLLGGHFLFAAIVAIVVWRIANYYAQARD